MEIKDFKVKLNNDDNYERLCSVTLTKDKFPIAYKNKLEELVKHGFTEKQAEDIISVTPIELEVYYHIDYGLFAVETQAVADGADIYSPYTGGICEPFSEE